MTRRTWKEGVLAAPAVGVSLLPKVICPVCSPVYAVLLSSVGLGFLISTPYLPPLTFVFLLVAVGAFGLRALTRRKGGPFWTGLASASGVLIGKFWFDSPVLTYAGAGLLVVASIWNAVPRRTTAGVRPVCLPTSAGSHRSEGT